MPNDPFGEARWTIVRLSRTKRAVLFVRRALGVRCPRATKRMDVYLGRSSSSPFAVMLLGKPIAAGHLTALIGSPLSDEGGKWSDTDYFGKA